LAAASVCGFAHPVWAQQGAEKQPVLAQQTAEKQPVLAQQAAEKQPVFLLCPHNKGYDAWSLYLEVSAEDPQKVLRLGLEKLRNVNLAEMTYATALAAQADPKVAREALGVLQAADFDGGMLKVERNKALNVSLQPGEDGTRHLMISLRVAGAERFTIGGDARKKRDVALKYDAQSKKWRAVVALLTDSEDQKRPDAVGKPITGLAFPVRGSGIYLINGDVDAKAITLLDRVKTAGAL